MNSRIRSTAIPAMATAAAMAGFFATSAGAKGALDLTPAAARCAAAFRPDSVAIQTDPIDIAYGLTENIGAILSVTPPEDSGIEVITVNDETGMLSLETDGAIEGAWTLRFDGDGGRTCSGILNVMLGG